MGADRLMDFLDSSLLRQDLPPVGYVLLVVALSRPRTDTDLVGRG